MIRIEKQTNRQAIFDRLESFSVDVPPLPVLDTDTLTTFDDPIGQFTQMLEFVGGEAHLVQSVAEMQRILANIPVFAQAHRIASVIDGIESTIHADELDDPHGLSKLDWTVAMGEFAVAENGSIWINGNTLPHRVMLFIAQYLAIAVSRSQFVSNMHEAYQRIGTPPQGFGVFVSGPSKTADIEQSLVLGAHGCRKLQVFLLP
ncbi:MAG: LUD domain-containing protein [Planctomycetota bacterium]